MYQGFQKCYQEALKTANEKTIEQIEKMNIIYVSILLMEGLSKLVICRNGKIIHKHPINSGQIYRLHQRP